MTLQGFGGARTAAYTGELALIADEWQYRHGYGPCLAAVAAAITVPVADMAADRRWPEWADQAVEAGVHSSLSIGIPVQHSTASALNVYSTAPAGIRRGRHHPGPDVRGLRRRRGRHSRRS